MENGTYVVISLLLDRSKPFVINAFHVKRDYNKFEESLRRNYGDKFV